LIRDPKKWQEWEENGPLSEPVDMALNFRHANALLELARSLGKFPPEDPLEGLDKDIRVARILRCSKIS
jgi:hypothetical protein